MVERDVSIEPAPKYRGRLGRAMRVVEIVEGTVGALLLAAILFLIMAQVIVRVSPLSGWVWTGELARFSLMWLTFVLAGYLLGRDQHVSLDIVDHLLPARGRRLVEISAYLVVAAVCAAFVYEGVGLIETQSRVRSSAAQIPNSVLYTVPTIGFALTGVRALIGPFVRKAPVVTEEPVVGKEPA
jgi:TRAP-type C4-dicarboxylate transport system permease small subunit